MPACLTNLSYIPIRLILLFRVNFMMTSRHERVVGADDPSRYGGPQRCFIGETVAIEGIVSKVTILGPFLASRFMEIDDVREV